MAMNPDTNKMEELALAQVIAQAEPAGGFVPVQLVRPDGSPVPEHWSKYKVGEEVAVNGYRWAVAHLGEKHMLLEPLGPVLVGEEGT